MRAIAWLKALTSCANAKLSPSVIALILVAALLHYHTQRIALPLPPTLFLLQFLSLFKVIISHAFVRVESLLLLSLLRLSSSLGPLFDP